MNCDRFSTSLALHRSLFSLVSSKAIAENELELIYELPTLDAPNRTSSSTQFTLTLLFQPNTRTLADASVSSSNPVLSNLNLDDLIGSHVQSNDVFGLVRGIMARARASL